ncbi:MAG TPA: TadE/TadG family type IV pilus assembly protein [Nocardioidaceae bacterium]|nr:TadE/TadG family type IV pilus assembly protein [Nocardioidaceae bacterium]
MAVEFAIILPVLLMLLFGITTAGVSLSHAIGLSNAVREGSRFGATNHPGGAILPYDNAKWTTWATDTIARVRGTQFDDPSSSTAVCVDMFKVGTGTIAGSQLCNQGNGAVQPALGATAAPSMTSTDIAAGTCVVRVWSARPFEVNLVVAPVKAGMVRRSAVTRFELRGDEKCLP